MSDGWTPEEHHEEMRQQWLTRAWRHDIALVLARAFGPALMREAAERARLT